MVHVLSAQQRRVALCISGGWADMGLLLAASLHVKLSLCPEWFTFFSGISKPLTGLLGCCGFFSDSDLGAYKACLSLPNRGVLKKINTITV